MGAGSRGSSEGPSISWAPQGSGTRAPGKQGEVPTDLHPGAAPACQAGPPRPSSPRPVAPPGRAGLVEVLGLWPPDSRNSSSRVAEASLRSCQGAGAGQVAGALLHFSGRVSGVTVGSLDLAAEGLACVLRASLRVCMYPGGSLGWGVGTKDLCARLALSSQVLCLSFSTCRYRPRSGERSVLGLLAVPGWGTRSSESGAAPPSSGLTCSLPDAAGGAWWGHTGRWPISSDRGLTTLQAAGWGAQVGLNLHCLS